MLNPFEKILDKINIEKQTFKAKELLDEIKKINPENFTEDEYKTFETSLIETFKELKYKTKELEENLKNEFLKAFKTNNKVLIINL